MDSDDDELMFPQSMTPTPTPSVTSSIASPPPSFRLQLQHTSTTSTATSNANRDMSLVRASMPELRTIRVKCRQTNQSTTPPLSIITTDMSTAELMDQLLERHHVKGLDPSNYCVVARIITKGRDVGVESQVLEESSHPFSGDKDKLKRSRFSIRQKGGVVAEVYDGRKWPTVRCGSVYVTSSDTTHRVTQSVLCTPNVQEKKRKASKYTVAIGTTHGHVQAFVKDNELLLPMFQKCQAQEKCLILIKKPKDVKRMLKAQSMQNLSVSDTHLYRHPLDGTSSGGHGHTLTAHFIKGGVDGKSPDPPSAPLPLMSQTYTSEPRVLRGHQQPFSYTKGINSKKSSSSSSNTRGHNNPSSFVPIPEMGIFTPEQHVLQNGTYAQHCHSREVTATSSNASYDHNRNNIGGNSSSCSNSASSNHDRTNNTTTNNKSRYDHNFINHRINSNLSHNTPSSDIESSHSADEVNKVNKSQGRLDNNNRYSSPRHTNGNFHPSSTNMAAYNYYRSVSGGDSSFEESVKSDGYYNSSNGEMMKRLDFHPIRFQQQQQVLQQNGVYHSCMDISALPGNHNHFSTLSSTNSDVYSVRTVSDCNTLRSYTSDIRADAEADNDFHALSNDQTYEHGYRSAREPPKESYSSSPPLNDKNNMDPSSRSHSLGDLTSGLTFSLVGQKKTDSMKDVSELDCGRSNGDSVDYSNGHDNYSGHNQREKYDRGDQSELNRGKSDKVNQNRTPRNGDDENGVDEVDGDYQPHRHHKHKPFRYVPAKNANNSNSSSGSGGSSALQHIRDRLQKAVLNSQKIFHSNSSQPSSGKGGKSSTVSSSSDFNSKGNKSGVTDSYRGNERVMSSSGTNVDAKTYTEDNAQNYSHEQRNHQHYRQPEGQSMPQASTHNQNQQHTSHFGPVQRQNSAPGYTSSISVAPSTDSYSNYQNTLSDPNLYKPPPPPIIQPPPPPTSSSSHPVNDQSNRSTQSSSYNMSLISSASSSSSYAPIIVQKSSSNSYHQKSSSSNTNHQTWSATGNQSPTKSKRSLPDVPIAHTSERIKRFTDMMKSRVSSHSSASNSRNGGYSADGSTESQNTPTRMSSVETTGSGSRKSSVELGRMADVETILGTLGPCQDVSNKPLSGPDFAREPHSNKQRDSKQSYSTASNNNNNNNRYYDMYGRDNDVGYFSPVVKGGEEKGGHLGKSHQGQGQILPSDDLHQTTGDHSSDSAHTSGTSTSYNGSTLDSGYITNNDGDNDSFNNHNNNGNGHHQQFRQQHTYQQYSYLSYSKHQQLNHQQITHQENQIQSRSEFQSSASREKKQAPPPPPPPPKNRHSNMVNSRRFGSVQNVSSAQAHGSPNDKKFPPDLQQQRQQQYSSQNHLNGQGYDRNQKPSPRQFTASASKDFPPSNQDVLSSYSYHHEGQAKRLGGDGFTQPYSYDALDNKPASRRSWDYADRHDYKPLENGLQNFHKGGNRYRSSDVLYSSSYQTNVINQGIHASDHPHVTNHTSHPVSFTNNSKSVPEREAGYQVHNGQKGYSQIRPHYNQQQQQHYHPPPQLSSASSYQLTNGCLGNRPHPQLPTNQDTVSHSHPTIANKPTKPSTTSAMNDKPTGATTTTTNNNTTTTTTNNNNNNKTHWNNNNNITADQQRKLQNDDTLSSSSSSSMLKDDKGVKKRPVPISRSNRNARGRTLPGGFRFNESETDPNFGQPSQFNFELSLYHMTQRYDISPLCLNLPKKLTLKDTMTLKEFTVEISLNESFGIPSSPQGDAPQIGSPGSAFTPVKHECQVQGQPVVLKVKVLSLCNVWEEVQKHSQLGRILEGDIVVEVNGWMCLGADVPYLRRIVENCQGAITLTVARKKETDEVRYKGQTPVERIKGLEMQISRLDDLIQARDVRIKELQNAAPLGNGVSTGGSGSGGQSKQVLTNVNGEVPCEGMRIGDDEYVV